MLRGYDVMTDGIILYSALTKILSENTIGKSTTFPCGWIQASDLRAIADFLDRDLISRFGEMTEEYHCPKFAKKPPEEEAEKRYVWTDTERVIGYLEVQKSLLGEINFSGLKAYTVAINSVKELEEREKGCKYCIDTPHVVNVWKRIFNFCPECGRKLTEEEKL